MFKDRLFLNGLGFGIVVGALLLQIMNAGSAADHAKKPSAGTVDDNVKPAEQIAGMKTSLEELGYQIYDKDEKVYTQEQLDKAVEQALNGQKNEAPALSPSPNASPAASLKPKKTDWSFEIPSGMGSDQLGDMLLGIKLIDSKQEFADALKNRHLESKLRAGQYHFDHHPSLDELLDSLTGGQ